MKKFITAVLCLALGTPVFAAPNYRYDMPPRTHVVHSIEYRQTPPPPVHHYAPPPAPIHHHVYRPTSARTKAFAAVAGVGIAAALISAIID